MPSKNRQDQTAQMLLQLIPLPPSTAAKQCKHSPFWTQMASSGTLPYISMEITATGLEPICGQGNKRVMTAICTCQANMCSQLHSYKIFLWPDFLGYTRHDIQTPRYPFEGRVLAATDFAKALFTAFSSISHESSHCCCCSPNSNSAANSLSSNT